MCELEGDGVVKAIDLSQTPLGASRQMEESTVSINHQPTDLVLRDPLLLQALSPSGAWEVSYRRTPDAYGLETFGPLFV